MLKLEGTLSYICSFNKNVPRFGIVKSTSWIEILHYIESDQIISSPGWIYVRSRYSVPRKLVFIN